MRHLLLFALLGLLATVCANAPADSGSDSGSDSPASVTSSQEKEKINAIANGKDDDDSDSVVLPPVQTMILPCPLCKKAQSGGEEEKEKEPSPLEKKREEEKKVEKHAEMLKEAEKEVEVEHKKTKEEGEVAANGCIKGDKSCPKGYHHVVKASFDNEDIERIRREGKKSRLEERIDEEKSKHARKLALHKLKVHAAKRIEEVEKAAEKKRKKIMEEISKLHAPEHHGPLPKIKAKIPEETEQRKPIVDDPDAMDPKDLQKKKGT